MKSLRLFRGLGKGAVIIGVGIFFLFIAAGPGWTQQKPKTIRLGHATSGTSPYNYVKFFTEKFAEKTKEYSSGKLEVKLFPDFQLGDEQAMAQATRQGSQEMVVLAINNLAPFAPAVGAFSLPYLYETPDQLFKIEARMTEEINQWVVKAAGVRILDWGWGGFRVLTNSARPVKNLNDLKGLRIRVPKNDIMLGTFKSWGITPLPLAWGETFQALQQKVIDGQENPYSVIIGSKFFEVQKYITDIDYTGNVAPLVISEKFYSNLSLDLQQALLKAAADAREFNRKWMKEFEATLRKEAESKGMVLNGRPNDFPEWVKLAKGIWPNYTESIGGGNKSQGEEVLNKFLSARDK